MRHPILASAVAVAVAVVAAALPAQNLLELPITASPSFELPNFSVLPFMQPNARVQMFYDATEVSTTPFVADRMELRWDGPIPMVGAPGPFMIQQLTIQLGVTTVPTPGAGFQSNLTQPLTTVFDGPWTYFPDPGSAAPHAWGGTNGTLTFPFLSNVPIVLQPGEWLVVDVKMVGNNIMNFGFAHAILDGADTGGGVTNGTATGYGLGCSAAVGQPAATATATGIFAPGGAHFLTGSNLGANAPVLGVFGLSNSMAPAPLPFTLPGTNCSLLASPDFTILTFANASGSVGGTALVLSLPADPSIDGVVVYEQLASLVVGANPYGIVFSDAVEVALGSFAPLGRGTFSVAHDADSNAAYANVVRPFGYAMRLRTL